MSKSNNFNPFTEPYHPWQLILLAAVVICALPFFALTWMFDSGRRFKGAWKAVRDIPQSAKDTYNLYSKH
jgi:hypothetical protein